MRQEHSSWRRAFALYMTVELTALLGIYYASREMLQPVAANDHKQQECPTKPVQILMPAHPTVVPN